MSREWDGHSLGERDSSGDAPSLASSDVHSAFVFLPQPTFPLGLWRRFVRKTPSAEGDGWNRNRWSV